MRLPVTTSFPDGTFWLREFARLEVDWARSLSEPIDLAGATVIAVAGSKTAKETNSVLNAWLPAGMSWVELAADVAAVFGAAGATCRRWFLNPSMPAERTDPIASALIADGWKQSTRQILIQSDLSSIRSTVPGFTIVPARSALPALVGFYQRRGEQSAIIHLDNPQVESWIALSSGRLMAVATIQISGKSAVLRDWFVDPDHRGVGVGQAVIGRAIDLCRRAEINALMAVSDDPAVLFAAGFKSVAEWTQFFNPGV